MSENRRFDEAEKLYKEGNYQKGLEIIDDLLNNYTKKSKYYNYKGLCLSKLNRPNEAIYSFNYALDMFPNNKEFRLNKASALVDSLQYREAHKILDKCLMDFYYCYETNLLKAKCFFNEKKYDEADDFFKRLSNYSFDLLDTHKWIANSYQNLKNFEKAIESYNSAINLNPFDKDSYYQKALCLMELRKYSEALTQLEKVKSYDPNYPNLLHTKAQILFKCNRMQEALTVVSEALSQAQNPEYYETKGFILYGLANEDEAIVCFMKAINRAGKPNPELLEKMNSIIANYKKKKFLNLGLIQEDFEKTFNSLFNLPSSQPLNFQIPTFTTRYHPLNWKEIMIEQELVADYNPCLEHYFCKICYSLLKNPKKCEKCENLFCSDCLVSSLNQKNCCPICRDNPFTESRIDKTVRNTLNSIEVTCPMCLNKKSKMENLEKHLLSCQSLNRNFYSCDLCKVNLNKNDELELHKESCLEALCRCPLCKVDFKRKRIDSHISDCPDRLVICNKCNFKAPFKMQEYHKNFYCEYLMKIKEKILNMIKSM